MLFPVIPGGVQYAVNRHVQNISGFIPHGGRDGVPMTMLVGFSFMWTVFGWNPKYTWLK
jgi:hypothetical protein